MKRLVCVIITLVIMAACTPEERAAVDRAQHLPEGTTHQRLCDANPADPYCGSPHDALAQAIVDIFPVSQHHKARSVAMCESGDGANWTSIDMHAVSKTGDHGPFQINSQTWNKPNHSDPVARYIGQHWGQVYDPVVNTHMAFLIWKNYGWRMWSCA